MTSANEVRVKLPLGEKAAGMYAELSNSEHIDKDFSYILEHLRSMTGK